MANKKNGWKLLVVLAFGITFVGFSACSGGVDRRLNGTWKYDYEDADTTKFNSGYFEESYGDGTPICQGTYTTGDGEITFTVSHFFGTAAQYAFGIWLEGRFDPKWYSKDELEKVTGSGIYDNYISEVFDAYTQKYTVDGSTLTFFDDDGEPWTMTSVSRDGKFTLAARSNRESAPALKSSGRVSAIPGRWHMVEGPSGYPSDVDLLKDGTGIAEDAGFTWKIENGRFYIIHPFFGLSAIYNLSGSTLTLTKDDGVVLKYNKR